MSFFVSKSLKGKITEKELEDASIYNDVSDYPPLSIVSEGNIVEIDNIEMDSNDINVDLKIDTNSYKTLHNLLTCDTLDIFVWDLKYLGINCRDIRIANFSKINSNFLAVRIIIKKETEIDHA